jgi:glycosyltransferase involved in cell wall biosynthesis
MPEVSIIVPNYNHAAYLDKRIESILLQTFQDFELILLDDRSTDNSAAVLDKYKSHPKVSHLVYNETNSGSTFAQWEKGIGLAKGAYIWIAESDDFCEPSFLQEMVSRFRENSEIVVGFCQSLFVNTEGRVIFHTDNSNMLLSEVIDGKKFVTAEMLGNNSIVNSSMAVFRKSVFHSMTKEYATMTYCGDWLFWVNACLKGKVFRSGKYLNYYLRHDRNVANKATKKGLDFIEGNKVYHHIKSILPIDAQENRKALYQRLNLYLQMKGSFSHPDIEVEVLKSVRELDPDVDAMMKKILWKRHMNNFLVAVKNPVRKLLK